MELEGEERALVIQAFSEESAEYVVEIGRALMTLEGLAAAPERHEVYEEVCRLLHNFKGMASVVDLTQVASLTHKMEDVVRGLSGEAVESYGKIVTGLLAALDSVKAWIERSLKGEKPAPEEVERELKRVANLLSVTPVREPPRAAESQAGAEVGPTGAGTDEEPRFLRVPTEKLEMALARSGEMVVSAAQTRRALEFLGDLGGHVDLLLRLLKNVHGHPLGDSWDKADRSGVKETLAKQCFDGLTVVKKKLGSAVSDLSSQTDRMDTLISLLLEVLRELRMQPASSLLEPFHRPVRDLALQQGKEVQVEIHGGEIRLDKKIQEGLKEPLMHLMRNAVAHGIELPEKRQASGKPRKGKIRLSVEQRGNRVAICVQDDGKGIDLEAVRKAAVKRGLTDQSTGAALTQKELYELLFRPGFSTAAETSELSGRGVGLDVVSKNVGRLHGFVSVDSTPGLGTAFTLVVPLTLAATRGLLLSIGNNSFALPIAMVEEVVRVSSQQVHSTQGIATIHRGTEPIPLFLLADLLSNKTTATHFEKEGLINAIVLGSAERRMALSIEEVLGEQEIIIKELPGILSTIEILAGGTILGDGRIVPVLNPEGLIRAGMERVSSRCVKSTSTVKVQPRRRRALIVDDSATTRMVLTQDLETAGWVVAVACDGNEAIEILDTQKVDVVVSDLAMPGMNGLELVRRIRSEAKLAQIPFVLLTSKDSEADRTLAGEAGANAFISKKDFGTNELLRVLGQLAHSKERQ